MNAAGRQSSLKFRTLAVAGWYHAYYVMFGQFMPWDDEGTMMSMVKSFLDGGILYEEVPSPGYGPVYYLQEFAVHDLLGVPQEHDANRLVSIGFWVAIASSFAAASYRIHRRTRREKNRPAVPKNTAMT